MLMDNDYNPAVSTAVVKDNNDSCVLTLTTEAAQDLIRTKLIESLDKLEECKIELPETYEVEMTFKELSDASTASYYPGVKKIDSNTVRFVAKSARELDSKNVHPVEVQLMKGEGVYSPKQYKLCM